MKADKSIGEKVKELLELRQMSQEELSKITGISVSTISKIVNDKKQDLKMSTIEKLAKALRINPDYFFVELTFGPKDLFEHLTQEERQFLLDEKNLPWLTLSIEAKEQGLTPKDVEEFIALLRKHRLGQ